MLEIEDLIAIHTQVENEKIKYTDIHLKILELQREERRIIRQIIIMQNKELQLSNEYDKQRGC